MIEGTIPPLYKYHRYNKNLFSLLLDTSFWMGNHKSLNDLYECRFDFSDEFLMGQIEKNADQYLQKWSGSGQEMTKEKLKERMMTLIKDKEYRRNALNKMADDLNFGICSFTFSNVNDTLWAYYTEGFKGVCLEFNFNEFNGKKDLYKVDYKNERLILNEVTEQTAIETLYRKKESYRWEEEVRLVTAHGNIPYGFDKSMLTGIYFGYRMNIGDIRRIISLIKLNGYINCKFFEMVDDYDKIEIEFRETSV